MASLKFVHNNKDSVCLQWPSRASSCLSRIVNGLEEEPVVVGEMSKSAELLDSGRSSHLWRSLPQRNKGASSLKTSNRAAVAPPSSPPARRLESTSWVNVRSVLGLVLVFAAVAAGTLVLERAQQLVPVYAAARDLPSGIPLSNGDLLLARVRLPAAELARYLQPGQLETLGGKALIMPLRQHMLVPADGLAASDGGGDLVELAIKADHDDMPFGLRPGDRVDVLAAFSDGLHKAAAQPLVASAEVVRVLEDSGGLGGGRRQTGVQVRVAANRASSVAAAIANGRVFVVKDLSPQGGSAAAGSPPTSITPSDATLDGGNQEPPGEQSSEPGGSP
jgi:hypothetical protein